MSRLELKLLLQILTCVECNMIINIRPMLFIDNKDSVRVGSYRPNIIVLVELA